MKAIQKRRAMTGQSGFTLIELLVVIAILGVLAAVVVFAVGGINNNSQESACDIERRTIRTAVQAEFAQTNAYPANIAALVPDFLDEAPTAGRWDYDAATGAVTATAGGDCDI